ncbi:MAG: response regulator [Firmicutes bacterium]|nr:response regulator [Bacillota bacterium]
MAKRILLVDDANIIKLMLRKILVEGGYEIAGEASTGEEAVKKYQELRPDLVTMDITMNGMGGINALKAIRKIDPNAKVIMCSAMGQKYLVMEAVKAGAINFIMKPFEADKVLEAVDKAFATSPESPDQ